MHIRAAMMTGILLTLACSSAQAAPSSRMILALGRTEFLNPSDIQGATGALVKREMEQFQLTDFAVVVLADISYTALPGSVQERLVDYVSDGGALLITGGPHSFGSGGYQAVSPLIPFEIRSASDWRITPFRPPVVLLPSHPIMAGVSFLTVGALNDMNPRSDATEILQTAGGGSAGRRVGGAGGGSFLYPLVAEISLGSGRVIGIALDLNEFMGMQDLPLFGRNTLVYLMGVSRMGQGR
jgi:hypothetical protein